jgi:hypothetical protein
LAKKALQGSIPRIARLARNFLLLLLPLAYLPYVAALAVWLAGAQKENFKIVDRQEHEIKTSAKIGYLET